MADLKNYLRDLGLLLKRNALSAREELSAAAPVERAFLEGKLLAYNEVLSLIVNQAAAFGIDLDVLALKGFDPDRQL